MLVDPSLDDLLDQVDNKFKLVTLAMKRARQINDGYPLLVDSGAVKPVSLALQEVKAGLIFVREGPAEEPESPASLSLEDALAKVAEADQVFQSIESEEEARIEAGADGWGVSTEEADAIAAIAADMSAPPATGSGPVPELTEPEPQP